ncbi:MAG: tripartite tricarboxylate transporter TctB family protein [Burkholderiaceae bacterium]|nr:tripartite tricarboxylate transporter TctB family protein [Burkholderiaceae bacterium]
MTALFLVVASVIGLFIVSNYPDASKIMPLAIMAGTLLLSAVWIVQLIASGKICVDSRPTVDWAVTRRLLIAFGCLAFMLLGVSTVGFFSTYLVIIPLSAWLLGYRNIKGIAFGTIIFCAALYLIFIVVLNRPLPVEIWMVGA